METAIKGLPLKGLYRGYMGIIEEKMETTIQGLGFRGSSICENRHVIAHASV